MDKKLFEKDFMNLLHDKVRALTGSILDTMKKESVDLRFLDKKLLGDVYMKALFNVIEVIYYPYSLKLTDDQKREIFNEYEDFALKHIDSFAAICDTLSSWKPDSSTSAESESVVECTAV